MKQYRSAKRRIQVSVGDSVRIVRELQGLSQNQLAKVTRIPQTTISAIENDRVRLGVERAKVLAKALKCPDKDTSDAGVLGCHSAQIRTVRERTSYMSVIVPPICPLAYRRKVMYGL